MKNKRTTSTDIINVLTESFLYDRFKLLALNMFEWDGLDELGIEERHIEEWLFSEGSCLVFNDSYYGLMCLPCSGHGTNVYGDPTEYIATGVKYTKHVKAKDCVLVENNKLRMPTGKAILYFVNQLYNVVRTRDVNIATLKLPFIIPCSDKDLLTSKKLLKEVEENNWAVIVDKKIVDIENCIKVLPTGVKPFTAELTDQYHDIMNEALTYLGINNANTDKKERLITSEANANNQFIESCAQMFLEARQRACDNINEMFGTNLSVRLRNEGGDLNALELISEYPTNEQQSDNAGA